MSLLIEILADRDSATHYSVSKSEATVFVQGQQAFRMKANKMAKDDLYFRSFGSSQQRVYLDFNLSRICVVCTGCQSKKDIMIL